MKKNIVLCLSIAGFLLFPTLVKAQENRDSVHEAKMEQLKKMRRDLFIQKLGLTNEEAEKFFPVFDEYQQKLRESKKEFKKKWKDKLPEQLSEEEAKQYLADATKMREKELELFKTYSEKLKTVIPAKKIILIPKVTKEVQKELVTKAREWKRQNGGGKHGGMGGQGRGKMKKE